MQGRLGGFLIIIAVVIVMINLSGTGGETPTGTAVSPRQSEPPRPLPVEKFEIVKSEWRRSAFGIIAEGTFWLRNGNAYTVKDAEIECVFYGKSDTPIQTTRRTIYDYFAAGKVKQIAAVNFGFLSDQAHSARCRPVQVSDR